MKISTWKTVASRSYLTSSLAGAPVNQTYRQTSVRSPRLQKQGPFNNPYVESCVRRKDGLTPVPQIRLGRAAEGDPPAALGLARLVGIRDHLDEVVFAWFIL